MGKSDSGFEEKVMVYILIGISTVCVFLIMYSGGMKLQLRHIKKQLEQRRQERSSVPVSLEFSDRDLREFTAALNETLKQENRLRVSQEIQERELKKLITNISHDLRTPLTVMKGYLQLLERCEVDEEGREYLEICFRHTGELEKRISQLFEYSYWTNQEQEVSLHPVNISNLVTDAMTDFIPVFEEKGLSMRLESETVQKGMADEELIGRIMQNILKNCLQYAVGEVVVSVEECSAGDSDVEDWNARGSNIRAWNAREKRVGECNGGESAASESNGRQSEDRTENFRESSKNGRIKISVTNQTEGNCEIDTDMVFNRFYVGNPARNQSTGLGLSIVKILAEMMNGEVFAGKEGTEFTVGFLIHKA